MLKTVYQEPGNAKEHCEKIIFDSCTSTMTECATKLCRRRPNSLTFYADDPKYSLVSLLCVTAMKISGCITNQGRDFGHLVCQLPCVYYCD